MIYISRTSVELDDSLLGQSVSGVHQLKNRNDIGFFDLIHREQVWDSTEKHAQALQKNFQHFVFIGIGGSGLGGKMVHQFLKFQQPNSNKLYFLENLDPTTLDCFFRDHSVSEKWHWVFISHHDGLCTPTNSHRDVAALGLHTLVH